MTIISRIQTSLSWRVSKRNKAIDEIMEKISIHPYNKYIWIGKDYSVQNLIDDLNKLR